MVECIIIRSNQEAQGLQGKNLLEMTDQELTLLIPKQAYEIAKNPENVRVIKLDSGYEDELAFAIVESNCPVSDAVQDSWNQWQAGLQSSKGAKWAPKITAPENINVLHSKYDTYINSGELSLSDDILLFARLKTYSNNPEILLIADYDGKSGVGISGDFYQNTLPKVAIGLGYRYIVGENNSKNSSFFLEKLGRLQVGYMEPSYVARMNLATRELQNPDLSIQFLYPEDKAQAELQ